MIFLTRRSFYRAVEKVFADSVRIQKYRIATYDNLPSGTCVPTRTVIEAVYKDWWMNTPHHPLACTKPMTIDDLLNTIVIAAGIELTVTPGVAPTVTATCKTKARR